MHIRRATTDDIDAVNEIIGQVYVGEGWANPLHSPDYVRSLLDAATRIEQAEVLIAFVDDEPVGSVTVTDGPPLANIAQPGELEVRMLAVLPQARRLGVAGALMQAAEDLAGSRGMERVVLSTDPAMTAAQALYSARGYDRTPGRDWEINGSHLITYALDLESRG
ncbi:MAG: GNAT family N-acetyltransferase [Candidatus Nanopelagicales bacterium]|nr:GNAT family N-acetyltransferase [Candidatus Nanopelagicales bacterium]